MAIGFLYWILLIVGVIFGFVRFQRSDSGDRFGPVYSALLYILLGILGYAVFGWPFKR